MPYPNQLEAMTIIEMVQSFTLYQKLSHLVTFDFFGVMESRRIVSLQTLGIQMNFFFHIVHWQIL
ncbi:CLUMA_CG002433, isoform A [Clunio marinus]|uniref:CLUMA_CG002433, isoform A n=1 Tax=Clunio marinus TaxID=568069 RepID=A0A1J1HL46_9DIPT|nr:CLUMA_CG002433, isoform A [Clunio marinus]